MLTAEFLDFGILLTVTVVEAGYRLIVMRPDRPGAYMHRVHMTVLVYFAN
jgi:hypothetical protein